MCIPRFVLPIYFVAALAWPAMDASGPAAPRASSHKVVAYYFHTDSRCSTCKKIEAFSREAIEKGFANELKEGRLEWRTVNYESPEHRHFIQDYKLVTKSLVLVELVDGKQKRWTNLKRVWMLTGRKDEFVSYVRAEVRALLSNR